MGCLLIRKRKRVTELWCDGAQDYIDEWIESKFGKINLNNKSACKKTFEKIINNKSQFISLYNRVKKDHYAEGEPRRDMTLYEFVYHLYFGLGSCVDIDNYQYPQYLNQAMQKQVEKKAPERSWIDKWKV